MRRVSPVLALLAACGRDLVLPPVPQPQTIPPAVTSFAPGHAFAGALVRIQGRALAVSANDAEVHFGTSGAAHVTFVSGDGTEVDAVVPDEATTGPVVVASAAGRAVSAAPFKFDGAGHLRRGGRVVAVADLTPQALSVELLPGSGRLAALLLDPQLVVERLPSGRTVLDDYGVYDPLSLGRAGDTLLFGDGCPQPCTATGGELLSGELYALGDGLESKLDLPVLMSSSGALGEPIGVAGDPSARYVVVAGGDGEGGWLVDRALSPPNVAQLTGAGIGAWEHVAWAAGDFFLAEGPYGVAVVDGARPDSALSGTFGPALGDARLSALAADGHGLAALGTNDGQVLFVDFTVASPAVSDRFTLPTYSPISASITSLAFSEDGTRLAVSQGAAGRVTTLDARPLRRAPLATVALEGPRGVSAGPRGTFYVAVRGGAVALSSETGQVVSTVPLRADLRSPRRRVAACGDDVVVYPLHPELDVAAVTFATIYRRDEHTLAPLPDQCQELLVPDQAPPPIGGLAAAPGLGELFVRHVDEVRRAAPREQREDQDQRWSLPPQGDRASDADLALSASPDGAAALLVYDGTRDYSHGDLVAVLDSTKDWSKKSFQPRSFGLGGRLVSVAADDAGHLALLGDTALRVLDLAAALRGEETKVFADVPFDTATFSEVGTGVAQERLFVLRNNEDGTGELTVFSLADGAHGEPARLPLDPDDALTSFTVSPGGRRLWWLSGTGETRRLETVDVEPETGRVLDVEPAVPMAAGARELVASPDGEHLTVIDGDLDRVLLLE